jgi:hypothetical protein
MSLLKLADLTKMASALKLAWLHVRFICVLHM